MSHTDVKRPSPVRSSLKDRRRYGRWLWISSMRCKAERDEYGRLVVCSPVVPAMPQDHGIVKTSTFNVGRNKAKRARRAAWYT